MKILIAVEGSDGTGKATQTDLLEKWFSSRGKKVVRISFPRYNQTTGGSLIYEVLKSANAERYGFVNVEPMAASLLYAMDRRESLPYLLDAISDNDVVIFDRYVESNLLHQGGKLPPEKREDFSRWLFNLEYGMLGLPSPHMVIYLSIPFEVSLRRATRRAEKEGGKLDAVESNLEYVKAGSEAGKFYAEKLGWAIIDCCPDGVELSIPLVQEQLRILIKRRFALE